MKFLKAIIPVVVKRLSIPTPDGEQYLELHWKRWPENERIALLAEITATTAAIGKAETQEAQLAAVELHFKQSRQRIRDNLQHWVFEEDGEAVPLTDEVLTEVLRWTEYRAPLDGSFIETLSATERETQMGNSSPQAAISPAQTAAAN